MRNIPIFGFVIICASIAHYLNLDEILTHDFSEEKVLYQIPNALVEIYNDKTFATLEAKQSSDYSFAPSEVAQHQGQSISLNNENKKVSQWLNYLKSTHPQIKRTLIIVPGMAKDTKEPLHPTAQKRLRMATHALMKKEAVAIMPTGGNVHPTGTPFNEAYEMKKYLIDTLKVPEEFIAIDPYARNTVTNLRNTARFMLAHEIEEGLVVTTWMQNAYIGFQEASGFKERSIKLLGYPLGTTQYLNNYHSLFHPYPDVFQKSEDKNDP